MSAKTLPDTTSWNILAEIPGKVTPNEVVVMGGHTDSWDVGQGAIDDGGGVFSTLLWLTLKVSSQPSTQS